MALAALGSTLQNTFAAGNRVLDILDESPAAEEIRGKEAVSFTGAEAENVALSGNSVEEINTANLREMESFVTQETHLFHDSIRNNLRIAKLDASDQEIQEACRKASIGSSGPNCFGMCVGIPHSLLCIWRENNETNRMQ